MSNAAFDPFSGSPIEKIIPLIEPQQEIWMSCQIGGEHANRAYNESLSLSFEGYCNYNAMARSLNSLVNRYEVLRGVCSADGKNLCIFSSIDANHEFYDLAEYDEEGKQQFLNEYIHKNADTAFDLINGPLFRSAFFLLDNQRSYLVITVHHIIVDGWSFGLLLQDLGKFYSAYTKGILPILKEIIPFSKYAFEETAFSKSFAYQQLEVYWNNKLKQLGEPFELPLEFERPAIRTFKSKRKDFLLKKESTEKLYSIASATGATLVSTLIACFETFLYKLSYADQIIIGIPAAGQLITGNYQLVGHCVNLLPIISRPTGEIPFLNYVRDRKSAILNDYDHQRITFGSMLQKLSINRSASSIPLVPIVLNIDIDIDQGVAFEGLQYKLVSNPRNYENFEIFLNITGSNGQFVLEWSYNISLFSEKTIDQYMDRFDQLLNSINLNPEQLINDIKSVDDHSILQSLENINKAAIDYPKEKCVHHLFEENVLRYPNQSALTFNDTTFTYKQLNERANQIAHYLIEQGIIPGDIVAVCLSRSADMIAAVIAVYKTGAAYLAFDPAYPANRIKTVLELAKANNILTEKSYFELFPSTSNKLDISRSHNASISNPNIKVDSASTSFILFTSGSTGEPKGVMLQHHSLTNVVIGLQKIINFTIGDKLLMVTTIIFDLAQADIFMPLVAGGEIVLTNNEEAKDGYAILKLIKEKRINYLEASPATYKFMLQTGWTEKLPIQLTSCGEALAPDLAAQLLSRCDALYNMYGPTENTIYATAAKIESVQQAITIGKPFQNTEVYILDEKQELVPMGSVGEIYIGGEGVAKGYLNDPIRTKERFLPCPFSSLPNARMFRTGDLGAFTKDGNIDYLGRKDNQVKIRGLRIELEEIEFHIRKLTDIKDAVVTVRKDIVQGQSTIVAYIISAIPNIHPPTTQEIKQWRAQLSIELPVYFIPNVFVRLLQFPMTQTGKINRKALMKPEYVNAETDPGFLAPTTKLEIDIAAIWKEALNRSSISIGDHFFDIGGHSLIAIQVMSRIKKDLGKQLPISVLFQYPTIQKLAQLIENESTADINKALVPIKPTGTKPPLYVIHGDGLNVMVFNAFAQFLDEDQPVIGIQAKGLNGIDFPADTIEEIAAEYLKEILEHNPHGPYLFAGYSFGGLVAYELTQQVTKLGKKVKLLGILDTNISNESYYYKGINPLIPKIKRQIPKLAFNLSLFFKNPIEFLRYQRYSLLNTWNQWMHKPSNQDQSNIEMTHEEKVIQQLTTAYQNYNIQPIDHSIDLFRCKKRLYFIDDPITLGWKKFTKKDVHVFEVEGDHQTFLLPPLDKSFAIVIQKCLNERS
ncbi:MAG: amino acid adenylation domain-containing protein [Sphingobacteriia bacterium]|jgi:amino acid adenylation domain-containing protein